MKNYFALSRILMATFIFSLCIAANAATWYVSPTGTDGENTEGTAENPFATLTNAVAKAAADDEIILMEGTYSANVNITKKLTIRGETGNRDDVIVSPSKSDIVFKMDCAGSAISNLTIYGATDRNVVYFYKSGSIVNCRITKCYNTGSGNALVQGANNITVTVKDCLFDHNESSDGGSGIGLYGSYHYGKMNAMIYVQGSNSLIENCTVVSNTYVGAYEKGYILGFRSVKTCTIKDCEIAYNTVHFLDSQPEANPWILKTDVEWALCQNISIHDNHYWGVRQNLIACSVKDPNATINEVNNGPLYPQSTPEVKSRSVGDIDGLLAAIEAAEPWSEIVLEPGTYTLNALLNIKKPITIRGATGNRDDVIISGNAKKYCIRLWTDGATVKDLTVKDALVGNWFQMYSPIAIFGGGSVINCRITGIKHTAGSIVGVRNYNGTVVDTLIDGNEAVDNGYANNGQNGNGFYWQNGSLALLDRSIIANNRAKRVYESSDSKYLFSSGLFIIGGIVRNTQVSGNIMEYRAITETSAPVTKPTTISANRKALGIYLNGANAVIENCSVIDNISRGVPQDNVGGIVCVNGTVRNTLLWNNGDENGAKIVNYLGDKSKYSYLASDDVTEIEGGLKLTKTPYQYESGVAMPLTGAAMLGKGLLDPTWMTAEAKDLAGNPRLADGKVSIGATEFVSEMTITWQATKYRAYDRYYEIVEAGQVTGDTTGLEYWWDLDGDGVFEAKGPKQYLDLTKVGETVVTLKVTNTNGGSATFSQKFTIESYSNVMYVSKDNAGAAAPYSTPETAAARVEDALNIAPDGTRIIVAPGTYLITETLMLTNEVKIVGATGNRDDVVFDANHKRRVAWLDEENSSIEHVTFKKGYTVGRAYGVYSKGMLYNCRIANSKMMYLGGGPEVGFPHSALYVAGGSVKDCLIDGNSIYDGYRNHRQVEGIGVYQSGGLVEGCVVTNNYFDSVKPGGGLSTAGGVYLAGGTMRNSLITANYLIGTVPYSGNTYHYASGAIVAGGTFINNTVVGNESEEISTTYSYTLSSLIVKGSGVVKNTLVKDNVIRSTQVEQDPIALTGGTFVNCSTAENAYYFKNGVLKLTSNSPCRNAGANEDWMEYSTDLNGNTRLFGRRVDIGAVESQTAGFSVIVR